ncbi:MAG TPA: SulP family inorganic anion transporter [Ramlibacter sp.]|uniref:SulP family inorganic anion transporter n=1 Tax=Ramlibacter sp. TaxID=1917967 RepID=UPI002D115B43|nr:SulP family inorganic anion transporter [Ramlibacter sp.]HVZ44243.1 SulP family inorganic anion transporter [Ramlibacter sp.]
MANMSQRFGYGLPDQPAPRAAPQADASAQTHPWRATLRGDLIGGFAAAMLTIPVSMGYGILALSALGPGHLAQGVLAGLYAPVVGCIVAVLLGANTTMIYSPRSIVTFLIGSIVATSVVNSHLPMPRAATPEMLIAIVFLLIFLAGGLQALIGLLRFGTLVKYVPAPVIAGFANAAAFLIFLSQLDVLNGFEQHVAAWSIPLHLAEVKWLNLLVGVITCGLVLKGARLTKAVPPTILGMAGGIASYYVLLFLGLHSQLGPVVGAIPFSWPDPHYFGEFVALTRNVDFWSFAPELLTGALSLALIASLDGVLCGRLVEADSGHRVDANRELVRLGVGNMAAAGFGGIANGVNLGSSFANHRSGARTPFSLVVHSVVILAAILVISPLVGYLPRVVIGGMLTAVSIQLVDRWTLASCINLVKGEFSRPQSVALDLLVIFAVAVAAVMINVVVAVGVGIVVTILFFLFRMSKSVIRRSYRCDVVHSRRSRSNAEADLLRGSSSRIVVFELEGPVFFGTAENLAASVDKALREPTSHVILDLKRVHEIDSTGAKMFLQIHEQLKKAGVTLLVSSLAPGSARAQFLQDMGVTAALKSANLLPDADRAIERAEDELLRALADEPPAEEVSPHEFAAAWRFEPAEWSALERALERRTYGAGDAVFREGDTSRDLYLITKGSASVYLLLPGAGRETRLATFSPGTVFGELALLDQQARSATIEADGELVCLVLSHDAFEELARDHPAVAMKLLAGIGRELANRLRRASRTIHELAS